MSKRKTHFEMTKYIGSCGYFATAGNCTKDKTTVTCKICKDLISIGKE